VKTRTRAVASASSSPLPALGGEESASAAPALLPATTTTTMAPTADPLTTKYHHDAPDPLPPPLRNALRGAQFFLGFGAIYGSYKAAQLRAAALRAGGASDADVKRQIWDPQHAWAGDRMHALCVSLRGFYLKAGQFIGARGDFVPEPICRRLALLQDRVPPMPPSRAAAVLREELGVDDLSRVFEWIDLEQPLGSASVSQVHKARLRRLDSREAARILRRAERGAGASALAAPAAAASSSSSSSTHVEVTLAPGETAWSVANDQGVGLAELAAANPGLKVEAAREGDVLRVPLPAAVGGASPWAAAYLGLADKGAGSFSSSRPASLADGFAPVFAGGRRRGGENNTAPSAAGALEASSSDEGGDDAATATHHHPAPPHALVALARASTLGALPNDRIVAVKVQYPSAEAQMAMDLRNIRGAAAFLRSTGEIPFDLVSAVDELKRQIAFEFDFAREARVMDTIALHLSAGGKGGGGGGSAGGVASAVAWAVAAPLRRLLQGATTTTTPLSASAPARVRVPRSIPGLVTRRVLAMEFIEGVPLLQLADRVQHLPKWQRERAARRVLERVSEAYGRMILGEGLFQADGHPGNIMVTPGGGVALLDYGQSKQLPRKEQVAFARIVSALDR
jgi:predicted unusual protein kinase regulating ubiquinone biosynthesis (AarF/ABC1/UbiB family)